MEAWRLMERDHAQGRARRGEALVGATATAQRAYDDLEVLAAYSLKGKRADATKWLTEARWQNGKAMARGSEVHKIMEAYAYGREPEYDRDRRCTCSRYPVLDDHQPIGDGRGAAHNLQYGYAGTLDLRAPVACGAWWTRRPPTRTRTTWSGSPPPYPEVRASRGPTLEPRRAPRRP